MNTQGQLAQALVLEILPHGARLSPGTPAEQPRPSARDLFAAPLGVSGGPLSSPTQRLLPAPRDSCSNDLATIAEDRLTSSTLAKDGLPPSSSDDQLRGLSVLSQIPVMVTLVDEELGPVFQNELSCRCE